MGGVQGQVCGRLGKQALARGASPGTHSPLCTCVQMPVVLRPWVGQVTRDVPEAPLDRTLAGLAAGSAPHL